MRSFSNVLRQRTVLFFGAAAVIVGCGIEPTNPDLALGEASKRIVIDVGGGGTSGGGTPPSPTAPSITYELTPPVPDGDNGWYRSNVSLVWTITYNTTDVPTLVGCDEPTITEDQAATTYSCTATNSVGTAGPVSVTIKRDKTPPKVAITGVVEGGSYVIGAVPVAACVTTDDHSGVKTKATGYSFSASGDVFGEWHFTCLDGMDWAGNESNVVGLNFQITPAPPNNAPVANAGGPYTAVEGVAIALTGAGSTDADAGDVLTYAWDTDNNGQYDDATGATPNVTFPDNGSYTVGLKVTDSKGATTTATATVNVSNEKPTMSIVPPGQKTEGTSFSLSATALLDAPGDQSSLVVTYSCDNGATFSTSNECHAGDGSSALLAVGRVTDKEGAYTDYPITVIVKNDHPEIKQLTLPGDPVPIGKEVTLAAVFLDRWKDDGHTATVNWGDASTSAASVDWTTAGVVSGAHTYNTPGVYEVALMVKDDDGGQGVAVHQYVVVYDPSVGFVTGGGWIAYGTAACPTLCGGAAGRGDFGFVSKYKKGATVPEGDARFEFHAGTMALTSASYEWLVVAGKRAQFKGRGTINGAGDYGFLLTAVDNTTDGFRIKIWNRTTNEVVFDNQMSSSDDAVTLLNKITGSGSIVIHTR